MTPTPIIKLQVTVQELDFIVQRLTSGQMDFPTSQNVSAMLGKLQQQANDPTIQKPQGETNG